MEAFNWGNSRHKHMIKKLKWKLRFSGFFVQMKENGFGLEVSAIPFGVLNDLNKEPRWSVICHNYSFGGKAYLFEVLDRKYGLDPRGYLDMESVVGMLKEGRSEGII